MPFDVTEKSRSSGYGEQIRARIFPNGDANKPAVRPVNPLPRKIPGYGQDAEWRAGLSKGCRSRRLLRARTGMSDLAGLWPSAGPPATRVPGRPPRRAAQKRLN